MKLEYCKNVIVMCSGWRIPEMQELECALYDRVHRKSDIVEGYVVPREPKDTEETNKLRKSRDIVDVVYVREDR